MRFTCLLLTLLSRQHRVYQAHALQITPFSCLRVYRNILFILTELTPWWGRTTSALSLLSGEVGCPSGNDLQQHSISHPPRHKCRVPQCTPMFVWVAGTPVGTGSNPQVLPRQSQQVPARETWPDEDGPNSVEGGMVGIKVGNDNGDKQRPPPKTKAQHFCVSQCRKRWCA